jgi:hypothetical protein
VDAVVPITVLRPWRQKESMPPKVRMNEWPCKDMPKFSYSEVYIDEPHLDENEALGAFNVMDLQEKTWKMEA